MVVTWGAKYFSASAMASIHGAALWLSPWPMDLFVYLGLCSLAAGAEARWRKALWLTVTLSVVLYLLGTANAIYQSITR